MSLKDSYKSAKQENKQKMKKAQEHERIMKEVEHIKEIACLEVVIPCYKIGVLNDTLEKLLAQAIPMVRYWDKGINSFSYDDIKENIKLDSEHWWSMYGYYFYYDVPFYTKIVNEDGNTFIVGGRMKPADKNGVSTMDFEGCIERFRKKRKQIKKWEKAISIVESMKFGSQKHVVMHLPDTVILFADGYYGILRGFGDNSIRESLTNERSISEALLIINKEK